MKITDKIRRAIFKIGAEGASYFENCIWTIILLVILGVPISIALLQSVWKGLVVVAATAILMFAVTMIFIGTADVILSVWPFDVSDEEINFEVNYKPRIPLD